jgi:hypothetical protein
MAAAAHDRDDQNRKPSKVVMPAKRADFRGPQGRQDSNLQPPVLETGALPVELRPSVRDEADVSGACLGILAWWADQGFARGLPASAALSERSSSCSRWR